MNDELDGWVIVSTRRILEDYLLLFEKRFGNKWYTMGDIKNVLYDIKSLPDKKERMEYKMRFKELLKKY
ncbi:hypothetical protein HYX15_01385 [Candidatus Woesearchaeota archaeon]|nr:hypothetical protein [Candidatus Woesearchaeota archaeon]